MKDAQIEAAIEKIVSEGFPGPHPPVENSFSFTVSQEQDEEETVTVLLSSPEGQTLEKTINAKDGYALLNKLWDVSISEYNKA